MFLAPREIRVAKGRFALMTGVVALVTLLLVLLSSLTRGLGAQNTSAVESLPAARVLLAPAGTTTSWSDSVIEAQIVHEASSAATHPLGVTHAHVLLGESAAAIAVFGAPADRLASLGLPVLDQGQVVLPDVTAELLDARVGSKLTINGTAFTVAAIEPARWYSHSPVLWTTLDALNGLAHHPEGQATALLSSSADEATTLATKHRLTSLTTSGALAALPGYTSEHGSLTMIQGFLYGITALVVIAFLSVWTIQRTRDIAVLRALGASARYVLVDSLQQAAILLAIGAALGGGIGAAIALLAQGGGVPVLVHASTTLLPTLGVFLVGLLGAVVAIRRVTRVDPLLALGGN